MPVRILWRSSDGREACERAVPSIVVEEAVEIEAVFEG
jgi:hypothetical protein